MTSDLLDAVDTLTKPRTEYFNQRDDTTGKVLKIHSTEHPPLLEQLAEAVNPSTNTSAGSASLASTRNIIDSDALFEYSKMASAVGDWCRMVNVRPTRDPVADLRSWYVAFNATSSDNDWWYRDELTRWAGVIRNILEPPKRFEIITPCPACGSDWWVNPENQTIRHPIIVEYRIDANGQPVRPRARCRAEDCGTEWATLEAIEELGQELSEKHGGDRITTV